MNESICLMDETRNLYIKCFNVSNISVVNIDVTEERRQAMKINDSTFAVLLMNLVNHICYVKKSGYFVTKYLKD